ncbi:dihydrodipicolinate synthase family protein [Allomesorhizobium camelthorni]|uniref:dihydrodipicolinate synthase family protein n=1 Tax=Allomesorhizobium camelthorni TaxID=475069 RepID=UPI001FEA8EF8|nr:dihydrodipicolinate synthase family protein [Mesorhizobium camelthorni]
MRGVIAAVPTPVTAGGEPDVGRFLHHARWALANGCDALNVLGTTGEANSFSADQRKAVMSAAAAELDASRLMVGTGTPDLATTIALTKYACDVGFAAALVLPPYYYYYYKGVSDDGLFAWFERLILATRDAPGLVYLYNFPQLTGVPFSFELVRRLKAAFPERIAGAKDSSGNLSYTSQLAKIDGFDVFPSSETAIAKADADGYAGCISATVSVTAPLVAEYWAAPSNAALATRVVEARSAIAAHPLIPAVKCLVARLHEDPAFERVLPPHLPLTEAQKTALTGVKLAAE